LREAAEREGWLTDAEAKGGRELGLFAVERIKGIRFQHKSGSNVQDVEGTIPQDRRLCPSDLPGAHECSRRNWSDADDSSLDVFPEGVEDSLLFANQELLSENPPADRVYKLELTKIRCKERGLKPVHGFGGSERVRVGNV